MKAEPLNIATAQITNLTKLPFFIDGKNYWAMSIIFKDQSAFVFRNLPCIWLGDDSLEEAVDKYEKIRQNFADAHIEDGDKVALLFNKRGVIKAIGHLGCDIWIDVEDDFNIKTFSDFNIIPTSLIIH